MSPARSRQRGPRILIPWHSCRGYGPKCWTTRNEFRDIYAARRSSDRSTILKRSRSCDSLPAQGATNIGKKLELRSSDRAKLDVILGEAAELFAWPGGRSFDTDDPGKLLPAGFSGSGDFAGFVLGVFSLDQIAFEYIGPCDGDSCARFGYDVPVAVSGYVAKTPFNRVTLGYHGTFDVDSRSANLIHMTVIPTDVSTALPGVCDLRTGMTYTRATMDSGEFTIPESTEKEFLSADGEYFVNRSFYKGCRQYTSESTLTFGDDDLPATPLEPAKVSAALPVAGSEVQLRLVTKIDSERNGAGDALEATLVHPVPDTRGGTIRAGTVFLGRLGQVEKVYLPREHIILTMRFNTIILNGAPVALTLSPIGKMDARGEEIYSFLKGKLLLDKNFVSRWRVVP